MAVPGTVYSAEDQKSIDEWQKKHGDWDEIKHLTMECRAGVVPSNYDYQCTSTGSMFIWQMTTGDLFGGFFYMGVRVAKDSAKSVLQKRAIKYAKEKEESIVRGMTFQWTRNLERLVNICDSIEKLGFVNITEKKLLPVSPGPNAMLITPGEAILLAEQFEDTSKAVGANAVLEGQIYAVTSAAQKEMAGSHGTARFFAKATEKSIIVLASYDAVQGDEGCVRRAVGRMVTFLNDGGI